MGAGIDEHAGVRLGWAPNPFAMEPSMTANIHNFTMRDIDGHEKPLASFAGKVVLIVNVASECGLTPQYTGLQALYEELAPKGFTILGFPANEFGAQEPGTEAQIKAFCETRYHVTFPMFAKIVVKGPGIHPLYESLTKQSGFDGEIEWNFGKFLAGKDGSVIARFNPRVTPADPKLRQAILDALAQ